jgi:hypothetical protein
MKMAYAAKIFASERKMGSMSGIQSHVDLAETAG